MADMPDDEHEDDRGLGAARGCLNAVVIMLLLTASTLAALYATGVL